MTDFNFVTKRIATGAAIGTVGVSLQDLIDAGITHVIDCATELIHSDANLLGTKMVYLPNGVADDGQPKPTEWFENAIDFSFMALTTPHHKLYIHCAAGVNRGPSITFAILIAWGLSAEDAESMIRRARPQVGLAYKIDAINAIRRLGYQP